MRKYTHMASVPTFKLARLREIGWSLWDPIGLNDLEGRPDDEYDQYLLQAAAKIWSGAPENEVGAYLAIIQSDYMGLGQVAGAQERISEVVRALANYVSELQT